MNLSFVKYFRCSFSNPNSLTLSYIRYFYRYAITLKYKWFNLIINLNALFYTFYRWFNLVHTPVMDSILCLFYLWCQNSMKQYLTKRNGIYYFFINCLVSSFSNSKDRSIYSFNTITKCKRFICCCFLKLLWQYLMFWITLYLS